MIQRPMARTAATLGSAAAIALPALLAAGCSDSGGGHAVAGSTAAGSTAAGSTAAGSTAAGSGSGAGGGVSPVGPLHRKALDFEQLMQAQHLGLGQVQDVEVTGGQVRRLGHGPSRVLWTGFYAASQAMRYRATQDPDALASLERALWTLHDLAEIVGVPGVIARGYDLPSIETQGYPASGRFAGYNYNPGKPSRDQYTGWFYGVAQGFAHVQDPALRQALQRDVAAICDRLMANNLEMKAPWGPNGQVITFFDLKPTGFYQNQITPQAWATVDDFPLNLIARSVPYDPQLAAAIANAQIPPIRAGEALRAVFFFTVAAEVTGDPRYAAYKDRLLHQEGYADVLDKYLTILDDLLHGYNLPVVEDTLRQLFRALGDILQAYLVARGQNQLVTQVLVPLLSGTIANWLSAAVVDVIAWIQDPNNAGKLQRVMQFGQLLATVLGLVGQQQLAADITNFITSYGQHLSRQGLIDFSDTVRSHLGTNLTYMPLGQLYAMETNPTVKALYGRLIDRYHGYIAGDHNAVANLVHYAYGPQPNPNDRPHVVEALQRYPVDLSMREVDHSNDPGLVVSPWPDRFGRVGNRALVPHYFPIDQRAPDVFPWRGHPRQIKSGTNRPDLKVAPLGYLFPYWMARDLGIIGPAD
ncbi:MAG: hypothetical protein D6731_01470 [Planctomycetota bacterium]|nr:MAG: hypothetical protein D6731_01470 [Planctomycetota bacterium]